MPTDLSARFAALLLATAASGVWGGAPSQREILSVEDLRPGMKGEVWTVFQGTEPEPFEVEVVGVAPQGLGPGRAMIICKLTDPRVQRSGAAAGMSGSPLYIGGKWVGALSYQVQRFETVRHAGFTPAADMLAVASAPAEGETPRIQLSPTESALVTPLGLAYSLGGVGPEALRPFAEQFRALGINLDDAPLSGGPSGTAATGTVHLEPGSPIGVALAHGDLYLGATGTVSHVDGDRVLAFGHPMMGAGATALPLAEAEVITILPSLQNSFKLATMGRLIGTLQQDRLSAIAGQLGPVPPMIPVTIRTPERSLHFQVVREPRLVPLLAATGTLQTVSASNAQGGAEGYVVRSRFDYEDGQAVSWENWYEGAGGIQGGAQDLLLRLGVPFQSPFRGYLPKGIAIEVERLGTTPLAALDTVQCSATTLAVGETLEVTLSLRGRDNRIDEVTVAAEAPQSWAGRRLEVAVVNGPTLERLAGRPDSVSTNQIRTPEALRDWLAQSYRDDGAYVVVLERTSALLDEASLLTEAPGSFERVARRSDEARFSKREVLVPLWASHVFPGRLFEANFRRPLQVTD